MRDLGGVTHPVLPRPDDTTAPTLERDETLLKPSLKPTGPGDTREDPENVETRRRLDAVTLLRRPAAVAGSTDELPALEAPPSVSTLPPAGEATVRPLGPRLTLAWLAVAAVFALGLGTLGYLLLGR
ncbi:MAG: hypothetical protein K1X89_17780 [Myxococcaceae bacterium]|nr:hypothetical protein [Myxococcaceae bacterium]